MQKVERNQLWDVLRGGEWCRARVVNVLSDRVNLFYRARRGKRERRDGHAGRNEEFREISAHR